MSLLLLLFFKDDVSYQNVLFYSCYTVQLLNFLYSCNFYGVLFCYQICNTLNSLNRPKSFNKLKYVLISILSCCNRSYTTVELDCLFLN